MATPRTSVPDRCRPRRDLTPDPGDTFTRVTRDVVGTLRPTEVETTRF